MCCSHTWTALHARCRDMKGLMSLKQRDIKPLYRYARFNVSRGVSLHIEIWKVFINHLLTQDNDLIVLISLSWSRCLDLIVLCPWALFIKLLTHDHALIVLCPWAHDQLCRPASLWGATGPRPSISSANCMSHVQMVWGVRLKGKQYGSCVRCRCYQLCLQVSYVCKSVLFSNATSHRATRTSLLQCTCSVTMSY